MCRRQRRARSPQLRRSGGGRRRCRRTSAARCWARRRCRARRAGSSARRSLTRRRRGRPPRPTSPRSQAAARRCPRACAYDGLPHTRGWGTRGWRLGPQHARVHSVCLVRSFTRVACGACQADDGRVFEAWLLPAPVPAGAGHSPARARERDMTRPAVTATRARRGRPQAPERALGRNVYGSGRRRGQPGRGGPARGRRAARAAGRRGDRGGRCARVWGHGQPLCKRRHVSDAVGGWRAGGGAARGSRRGGRRAGCACNCLPARVGRCPAPPWAAAGASAADGEAVIAPVHGRRAPVQGVRSRFGVCRADAACRLRISGAAR